MLAYGGQLRLVCNAFSAQKVLTNLARRLLYGWDLKRQSGLCCCSRHKSQSNSTLTLRSLRLTAAFVIVLSPYTIILMYLYAVGLDMPHIRASSDRFMDPLAYAG